MDILAHIKSRGLKLSWVAQQAGVSRPTIYALGKPGSKPSIATVLAVAKVLGLKPGDIVKELAE